jgi:hypothetical protein
MVAEAGAEIVTAISAPGGALVVDVEEALVVVAGALVVVVGATVVVVGELVVVVGEVVLVLVVGALVVVGEIAVVDVVGIGVVVVVEGPGVVAEVVVLDGLAVALVVVEEGEVEVDPGGIDVEGGDTKAVVVAEGAPSPPFAITTPPATPPATMPTMAVAPTPPVPAAVIPAVMKPGGRAGAPARTEPTTMFGTFPWKRASRGSRLRHSSLSETSGSHSRVRADSKELFTASM